MKKKLNLFLNLFLVVVLLFTSLPSFAHEDITNKYGVLERKDIQKYIDNSEFSETVDILGVNVTYYYNDNYTVVDDPENGYFLITRDGEDIFVNNKMVEYREVIIDNDKSYSPYAIDDWSHFKTTERYYNIIGLVPSAIGGLIGGVVGSKITSTLLGAIAGLVVGGVFPEYYVSVRTVEEYRIIDTWNGVVEWRSKVHVYHGTKYDRWGNYWFGFTS
jgi:hypothetical protein